MFAIDFDGTIAATNELKSAWIRTHLGREVPPWLCDHTNCAPLIGRVDYARLGEAVYSEEATHHVPLVPGAAEALRTLAQHGPVYVVTARDDRQGGFARERLAALGLAGAVADVVSSVGASKIVLTRQLGCRVLVDDDARHLDDPGAADLVRIHLRAGCDRPGEGEHGIVVCSTWADVVAHCLAAARNGPE